MPGTSLQLRVSSDVDRGVPLRSIEELVDVVREGLASRYRGELRVEDSAQTRARVCIDDGRLAWIHCSTHAENLGQVLLRECGLEPDDLRRAMERCYATGEKLGEALAALELVSVGDLRSSLRRHLAAHTLHMLAMGSGLHATFIPSEHRYDRRLTFAFDELPWQQHAVLARACNRPHATADLAEASAAVRARCERLLWCGFVDEVEQRCLAEAHAPGFDATRARQTVIGDVAAARAAASADDGELESLRRGRSLCVALHVFLASRTAAAVIAPVDLGAARIGDALHELARAARLWQLARLQPRESTRTSR